MTTGYALIATHKLKVIASVSTNVPHNITIVHPFGNHREPPILEGVRNPDESEDVWMGQVLPYGHLFTEELYDV